MNAWEKTCDSWRLLAAELNGNLAINHVPMTKTHLATLDKQYRNWKISFQTTGHTITGTTSYVPTKNFTLHMKRKRFDWTDALNSFVPPLFMVGSPVFSTGFPEVEFLYSMDSNDVDAARKLIKVPLLRDVLMDCDQLQNLLICSMKIGSLNTGSLLLFDLGQPTDRSKMKQRFELFMHILDELEHLDLASPEAPQLGGGERPEDLFSKFNIFKNRN